MSSTVTLTQSLADTLQDYRIHLSAVPESIPVQVSTRQSLSGNPDHWPQNYRRVPPHRPINRNLDPLERPNGANTGEYVFVNVMLNGVRLNSLFVTSYERTFGKIYPDLTRYKIGGEW